MRLFTARKLRDWEETLWRCILADWRYFAAGDWILRGCSWGRSNLDMTSKNINRQ